MTTFPMDVSKQTFGGSAEDIFEFLDALEPCSVNADIVPRGMFRQ